MWLMVFCLLLGICPTIVFALGVLPTEAPTECVDESPFCTTMAQDGACYSDDVSVRSNMHDLCAATCMTCFSSIPSCDNGTESYNNVTNTTCCYFNDTDGNPWYGYSYREYQSNDIMYRNFSNYTNSCPALPFVPWWPLIWGEIWWYWMVLIAIGGLALGLFLAWLMFGQREEAVDELLEKMGKDSGNVNKKASEMTQTDITKITEYYKMMAALGTYETRGYVESDDFEKTPDGKARSPYMVLVKIFKKCTINNVTIVDKADFNMVMSILGISPMELDIPHVFDRLDDGSGKINVDLLYKAIEINIVESEVYENILEVLKVAILKTFVRERRASLSILKKYEDVHRTAGEETPRDDDSNMIYEVETPGGLVRTDSVIKLFQPEQKLLRSHDFNAFLVSMGVPISESDILERVLELEAMQPEGIDVIEFKYILEKDIKANPGAVKSDLIVEVLDHLINRHGGEYVARRALKAQHKKEEILFDAGARSLTLLDIDESLLQDIGLTPFGEETKGGL